MCANNILVPVLCMQTFNISFNAADIQSRDNLENLGISYKFRDKEHFSF